MKNVILLSLAAFTLAACQQPDTPAPAPAPDNMFAPSADAAKEEPKPKGKGRYEPQYTGKTF